MSTFWIIRNVNISFLLVIPISFEHFGLVVFRFGCSVDWDILRCIFIYNLVLWWHFGPFSLLRSSLNRVYVWYIRCVSIGTNGTNMVTTTVQCKGMDVWRSILLVILILSMTVGFTWSIEKREIKPKYEWVFLLFLNKNSYPLISFHPSISSITIPLTMFILIIVIDWIVIDCCVVGLFHFCCFILLLSCFMWLCFSFVNNAVFPCEYIVWSHGPIN